MALLIPNEGELELLDKCLKDALSVNENYSLRLFKVNKTPDDSDVAADYTAIEADFTGYVAKTLTRAGWGVATLVSDTASSTYGTVLEILSTDILFWVLLPANFCGVRNLALQGQWVWGTF
jgi:hypothetical protein